MAGGGVRQAAASFPASARNALLDAYHSGFSVTLNHLMVIGAVVAFAGAVSAFALVRQRDFIVPTGAPSGPPAQGAQGRRARRTNPSPPCMREPFTLEGTFVRLEPLTEAHVPALVDAAALDRSQYQWTYTPDGPEQMAEYVRDALAKVASGAQLAFATVRRGAGPGGSDLVVGATRFCELGFWQWPPGASHQRHGVPDVVDIGHTWLAGPAQRTPVNTEAKLLMMRHAFEVWEVHRVALQTDVRNARLAGGNRAHRGPAGRHFACGPARSRRHGTHLGPLLHRGGRVAGREGPAHGPPGRRRPRSVVAVAP